MIDPRKAAVVIIDMQYGFIDEASALCIPGAAATVPACARVLDQARACGMTVVHAVREYAPDGSDVEAARHASWKAGGKPVSRACVKVDTLDEPEALAPKPGDRVIVKPRFSAFFNTNLDNMLRRLGVDTVVVIGTTTPNCIRTTCYDALSLEYNVAVVEDCTSSRTPAVQASNVEDLAHIGVHIMSSDEFCAHELKNMRDIVAETAQAVRAECVGMQGCTEGEDQA